MSDDIKLKQAILSVLANVLNYPTDIQHRLLGVSVANLAEKTFRAVKESGLVDEREYEYAMQTTNRDEVLPIFDRDWTTLELAQDRIDHYTEAWERMGRDYLSATLIKRRKPGRIENV